MNNGLSLVAKLRNGDAKNLNSQNILIDKEDVKNALLDFTNEYFVVENKNNIALVKKQNFSENDASIVVGFLPKFSIQNFGSEEFKKAYNLDYAYMAGSMANEISSTEMVINFGKEGFLCSFGSGGVSPKKVEEAIQKIQTNLKNKPFCFNLIHSPYEPDMEQKIVDLYLKYNINVIEASAFINLTQSLVYYRVAGLEEINGKINIKNKVIAKISRDKIARRFMEPAPEKIVKKLLEQNLITEKQAELAKKVPMADDITVEADSGGHTDNRPLVNIYGIIRDLRDDVQKIYNYETKLRVGVGGGIGTPESMLAAFMMGADYVVTGSINQSCVEAGTSETVKKSLCESEVTDVDMAPAADMFEMGVNVQVLKKNTLYPIRAKKLYDLYSRYNSLDEIPKDELEKIETQFFQKKVDEIWDETQEFFKKRNGAEVLERAEKDAKKKMALIFRWYLGLSPYWARKDDALRKNDFQIWCGPSMGAFNNWVKGTSLADVQNRRVADVAKKLMNATVYLFRLNLLKSFGIKINDNFYEKYEI